MIWCRMLRSLFLAGLLAGCGGGGSSPAPAPPAPPAAAPTIPSVTAYLSQLRCPDGSLPLATNCAGAVPQKASDPQLWRRADWGNPNPPGYYLLGGTVEADDGLSYISIWSEPPFGPFVAANGDGGETYLTDGTTVRIGETQDGGTPGVQYFVGPACGMTGWIAFRDDAPNSVVATLSDQPSPTICPNGLSSALTNYYPATVALPFLVFGVPQTVTVPVIISDHYNAATLAASTAMERTYFGLGWGRLYWAAWGPAAPTVDLTKRCPAIPLDTPPVAGWQLEDCRLFTQIVAGNGSTVDAFGWPPP